MMQKVTTRSGAVIAYDVAGTLGPEVPFLLIEGLSAHLLGWREEFCRRFVDQGHPVIRFDNRDVGESQRYPDGGYTAGDMADDAKALLDALEIDRAHVVGQSMGGMISQELAIRHPEVVASMALFYSAPSTDFIKPSSRDLDQMTRRGLPSTRDEAVDRYVEDERECASVAYAFDETWKRTLAGLMWDRTRGNPDAPARQREALEHSRDRLPLLHELDVPTLVMHGTADALISDAGSRAIADAMADSRLRIYEGMGHELPRELWFEFVTEITQNAIRSERTGRVA